MARWDNLKNRGKVIDRRGAAPLVGGIGVAGVVLLLGVNFLLGGDLGDAIELLEQVPVQTQTQDTSKFEGADDYEVFASTVLGSNNSMWQEVFLSQNKNYSEPTLVLFRGATASGCGTATSQVGPHYCPVDETIYLDETFFDELTNRFGARGGDVAEAYVIGHEVAHHVQNQLGIMEQVQRMKTNNPRQSNELSVLLELQADCFAGMWAHSIRDRNVFEPGEIAEAMDAAAAVGDDRIQESAGAQVNPERWTHGSSEQRVEWFNRGFETGLLEACNTFEAI